MQFHDALARMYLSRYVGSLNKSTTECNTWRQKLNLFLRSSSYYTAESMLSSLPDDGTLLFFILLLFFLHVYSVTKIDCILCFLLFSFFVRCKFIRATLFRLSFNNQFRLKLSNKTMNIAPELLEFQIQ